MNEKRKQLEKEYRQKKKDDATLQKCRVCGVRDAKNNLEPHHPAGRAGKRLLIYFWVHPKCHSWIHNFQKEAEDRGLLMKQRNITTNNNNEKL